MNVGKIVVTSNPPPTVMVINDGGGVARTLDTISGFHVKVAPEGGDGKQGQNCEEK